MAKYISQFFYIYYNIKLYNTLRFYMLTPHFTNFYIFTVEHKTYL